MKLKFEHFVDYDSKKVWFKCSSSVTATAIPEITKKYFPGYTGHIASDDYFNQLKNENSLG
jgi:hypothetical protein